VHYTKLKISADATSKLRTVRQRLGLTPNLLCRYALMSSLEMGPLRDTSAPDQDGQEFNAYTLTGEHTGVYLSLLKFVEEQGRENDTPLSDEELMDCLRSHLHRGSGNLLARVRSIGDLIALTHGHESTFAQ
jgi:DNA sulfur modification protein DndE